MDVSSSPEELCQKLIEINKNYIIPNFNYKTQENISCYLNEINAELKFDSQISGLKLLYVYSKIGEKNELSKFYLKSLNYLNSDEIQKDYEETNNKRNLIFYLGVNFFKNDKNSFHNFLDYLKNLTLLSLYFHNYPYLLNLLSFQEVIEIFEDSIPQLLVREDVCIMSKELIQVIMNNESILIEKEKLKIMQIALIDCLSPLKSLFNKNVIFFNECYTIINLFRDIDFCLKLYLLYIYIL